MPITRKQLIKKFIEFYKSKNHKEISNFSLIPENDPTVLFTTAGMHPIVPHLLGQKHPLGKRLCNVQKCIRTGDIEEVGDSYHHTFFEMLGKWSIGDYWKGQAITYTFEFLTKELKIPINRIAVTCFAGDKNAEKDIESAEIWKSLGIKKERIAFLPKSDNWWETPGPGPCGPDTEVFYYKKSNPPKNFNPEDKNWIEIGNDVLMQYEKDKKGNYKEAKQKNIDFGGGVERTIAILNNLEDDYLSDSFLPIIKKIESLSKTNYSRNPETTKAMRIIADHIKASCFIISDGIIPSNTEQGYVLRRLIRRAVKYSKQMNIEDITKIAEPIFLIYNDYTHLQKNKEKILEELKKEQEKFLLTLEKGIKKFKELTKNNKKLSGKETFLLYQSYGFPIELTKELADEKKIKINQDEFKKELEKHQQLSRTAAEGRFKSGLQDDSEQTTKLHTATHLLLAALKKVLKDKNIHQKGSNITQERLRLDFNFPRKLTDKEIKQIEELVNEKIKQSLPITKQELSLEQAKQQGAEGIFEDKYEDRVSVYSAGDFSKEICAGPHVEKTSELGTFKIKKEESSSAGVRRIKAVLE
jgi:alanyl-tRNA synthetase